MNCLLIAISERSEVGFKDLLCFFSDGAVMAPGRFDERFVGLRRQPRELHLFTI